MNKRNLSVILVLALGIIFQTTFAFAQDSAKSKSSEEFAAPKKGNGAIYFEFGSLLFHSQSDNTNFELLLTAKLHLSDKCAIRISGGTNLQSESGNYMGNNSGTNLNFNSSSRKYSFHTSLNIQHFLSLKSKVKPFYSAGIYAKYSYRSEQSYYWYKSEEWGVGPFASFGVEMFVLDNISVIGEYVLKGTAGKRYGTSKDIYNIGYIDTYEQETVYSIDFSTFRAGLSIYF